MIHLIDTHAHFTSPALHEQLEAVIERSQQAGIGEWVTVGTDMEDNRAVARLCQQIENLHGMVGIHPHDAKMFRPADAAEIKQIAQAEKIVAIGEIGLDYHYDYSPRPVQRSVFEAQVGLAEEMNLPVVVHSREAFEDCLAVLDAWPQAAGRTLFHSFSGGRKEAQQVLDRGFYLSFSGVVTFKNAPNIQEAARYVSADRMLLETDCPFLSPAPHRGVKPNEPAFMVHTAEKIAQLRDVTIEDVAYFTADNSRTFFRLKNHLVGGDV
ncbi:MAG: TatD family hydrolase [Sedimentisphaerales bacterium]|nr:TatD family hydrolase [Sedimentisphaerales bacterium]